MPVDAADRQADQRGQAWHDVDCFDGEGLLEATDALAPEQDRHPPVIIPEAAMGRDIAPGRVGDWRDARFERDHQIA